MDNILDAIGQFFRTQESPDFSIHFSRYRRNAIGIINDEAEKAAPGAFSAYRTKRLKTIFFI